MPHADSALETTTEPPTFGLDEDPTSQKGDLAPAADDDGDDLLLERQLCFALSVASRSVIAAYRPVLAPMGITHPQYLVMLALWERSPRSVKDISAALRLENATISPLLKRLESTGLITRHRQPGNQRSIDVELTPKGRQLRQQAKEVPVIMAERLGLDLEDATQLNSMMQRLITAAHRATENDALAAERTAGGELRGGPRGAERTADETEPEAS